MASVTQLDAAVEFATNPEPRCACVLLLDVSGSMSGAPIDALNRGLQVFASDIAGDALARQRVEVAVVTFGSGGVTTEQDFVTAGDYRPTPLRSGGGTPMGAAIERAVDLVEERKGQYRANGVPYYRPWVFLITDGEPSDEWQAAADRVHRAEQDSALAFFAVGVQGANFEILQQIAVRSPLRLDGLRFVELFLW